MRDTRSFLTFLTLMHLVVAFIQSGLQTKDKQSSYSQLKLTVQLANRKLEGDGSAGV